jgi:hypothetical protein
MTADPGTADPATTDIPVRLGAHELVLLASVGPGCVNGCDKLLAAPGAGPLCALAALAALRLTPWLARALPDARPQLVQDTGHHLPRRAADAVADAIAAFLAATEGPARRSEMRNLTARGGLNIS